MTHFKVEGLEQSLDSYSEYYIPSVKAVKSTINEAVANNATSSIVNPTSDLYINQDTTIFSGELHVNKNSANIVIETTIPIMHNGGTPQIVVRIDGKNIANFFCSNTNHVYTFSCWGNVQGKGKHTISILISKGNSSGIVVPAYIARSYVAFAI